MLLSIRRLVCLGICLGSQPLARTIYFNHTITPKCTTMPIDHLEHGFEQIPWFLEHKFGRCLVPTYTLLLVESPKLLSEKEKQAISDCFRPLNRLLGNCSARTLDLSYQSMVTSPRSAPPETSAPRTSQSSPVAGTMRRACESAYRAAVQAIEGTCGADAACSFSSQIDDQNPLRLEQQICYETIYNKAICCCRILISFTNLLD